MMHRRTGLLCTLMLLSLDAFAQDSELDRAYDFLFHQQYEAAAKVGNAYLAANPRRYRADFIVAFADCHLDAGKQRGMRRLAAIERDYVLSGAAESDVKSLIAFCSAPKPKREEPANQASDSGNRQSFTSDSLTGPPPIKSAAPNQTDETPLPPMSGLVRNTSYSGDDYAERKGVASADECSRVCRVQAPCRSMTYAQSSKTCC
jgi:hypothetical protein